MSYAQPRHCLQRISCPDHSQPRAVVFEPSGGGVRLNENWLLVRGMDAGRFGPLSRRADEDQSQATGDGSAGFSKTMGWAAAKATSALRSDERYAKLP